MKLLSRITPIIISLLLLYGCTADEGSGTVLFYTNIQATLDCGQFDVEIYIDGELEGKLVNPLLPFDRIPDCSANDTLTTLKIGLPAGQYEYEAKASCLQYINKTGQFAISDGGCTIIHAESGVIRYKKH
jgi:hypothetical protein